MTATRARRTNAGNRMSELLSIQLEEDELFAEDEQDEEFVEREEKDVFDADFGDTDSEDEQILDKAAQVVDEIKKAPRKRDDFLKKSASTAKRAPLKRANPIMMATAIAKPVKTKRESKPKDWSFDMPQRQSYRESSMQQKERLEQKITERTKQQVNNQVKRRKVTKALKRNLTQEELLSEAAFTEQYNLESLEWWKAQEIERKDKARRNPKVHTLQGPVIRWRSVLVSEHDVCDDDEHEVNLVNDSNSNNNYDDEVATTIKNIHQHPDAQNVLIFDHFESNADPLAMLNQTTLAPPSYLKQPVCPLDNIFAPYLDPMTRAPYASTRALRYIRQLLRTHTMLLWSAVQHVWQGTASDERQAHFNMFGTIIKVVDADETMAQLHNKRATQRIGVNLTTDTSQSLMPRLLSFSRINAPALSLHKMSSAGTGLSVMDETSIGRAMPAEFHRWPIATGTTLQNNEDTPIESEELNSLLPQYVTASSMKQSFGFSGSESVFSQAAALAQSTGSGLNLRELLGVARTPSLLSDREVVEALYPHQATTTLPSATADTMVSYQQHHINPYQQRSFLMPSLHSPYASSPSVLAQLPNPSTEPTRTSISGFPSGDYAAYSNSSIDPHAYPLYMYGPPPPFLNMNAFHQYAAVQAATAYAVGNNTSPGNNYTDNHALVSSGNLLIPPSLSFGSYPLSFGHMFSPPFPSPSSQSFAFSSTPLAPSTFPNNSGPTENNTDNETAQ